MSENSAEQAMKNNAEQAMTLLFVDDEAPILSALKRLFRPHGYRILTAESGAAAIEILGREEVDLVISDMRMPNMDGAQFLKEVRAHWPQVVRLLLTGYADIASTVAAINQGEIYRYISKPWNDEEVVQTVRDALERKRLERENVRLAELTAQQNEELKALNASLEEKVTARTAELQLALSSLDLAHADLKKSFMVAIRVFSGLIEMRGGKMAGHARRVAEHARELGLRLGLDENEQQDLLLAGLLHDVGKLGLPDSVLDRPFNSLPAPAKAEVMRHPLKGQQVLMGIEQLAGAARIIRSHHECMDGSGYPDKLAGLVIPLGARILCVANEYDALQIGTLTMQMLSPADALEFVVKQRGRRYDPRVVDAFKAILTEKGSEEVREVAVRTPELKPGMILSRDLMHKEGYLLLARGSVLDMAIIGQLASLDAAEGLQLLLHVEQRLGPAVPRGAPLDKPRHRFVGVPMSPAELKVGMVLQRDLAHEQGYLLLAHGNRLDEVLIRQLREIEAEGGKPLTLYIRMEEKS